MKYSYVSGGQEVELELAEQFIAVRFKEPAKYSVRAEGAAKPELGKFEERYEIPEEKYTILPVAQSPQLQAERHENAVRAMSAEASVERVSPVFKFGETYGVATDRLMVGFLEGADAKKILKGYNCKILEQEDLEFVVSLPASMDPFEAVTKLDALKDVEYAEPDFVNFGSHIARKSIGGSATDPLQHSQYAITITKADKAWELQSGDPAIKIAILDEGVDSDHEDLAAAVVGSFDGVDADTFQEPKAWDAHGTACAGLAAAVHGNNRGIRGIGGGCSILAVRIAFSESEGANWTTRNSWIRRAIDWSWRNGADVLSNSWGGGAPSSAITNAFKRARTQGRGGKGAVVVVAAGNANSLHDYPGNLDEVLTVSASNEFDEPKTPTSQDGETWWGSNFGPKIDVAAPGVHNQTTDNTGRDGYNKSLPPDGNYVPDFNGTSSSTPIVAGAVGLVLSADPGLTEEEVRKIIRDTADKVGPLPYVDGRNDRMGHGRLNVLKAVQSALGEDEDELPKGDHAPVSNLDSEDDDETIVLASHPASPGSAKSAKSPVQQGRENVSAPENRSTRSNVQTAPDTSDLRNIAEASYGPPLPEAETVHGVDDRVRIEKTSNYPWRVHASLLITARDGSRWIGTAWFIGPRTLVTAGHCVFIKNSGVAGRDGWVRRIRVMPGRNETELPYGAVTSEEFHSVVGWTDKGNPQFDYGAIVIPTDLGNQVGTLGFGVLSNGELLDATGNLAGYPGDKPSGTQWYHYNRIASVTPRKVFYDIDTAGGQSGAAVYRIDSKGNRTAFGIHAYGGASTNSATRISTPVFQNLNNWLKV